MVLKKCLFKENDQIKIVRIHQPLGVSPGGFYQLEDKDEVKLDL